MHRITFKSALIALATTTCMTAVSFTANAQIDEIIVTAQKREQNLQDVPIAITALNLEALETNRIAGVEDLGRIVPGLNVTPNSADANGVQINIRGIGILDPQIGQDARVAIYQDGVYIGKTQGLALDLPDLARVEVLKGPQGTLYGRNSVAGAVNLVSQLPDPDEFSGNVDVEVGNFGHTKASGAINVPLGDAAAVRLSGLILSRDGWVENEGLGVDFGGEEKFGVRGAVGINVSETIRVDVAGDFNQVEKEPLFYQSFGPGAQPFSAAVTPFDDGRQESASTSFNNELGDLETWGVSGIASWEPNSGHEVKATVAYREADSSRFVTLIPTTDPNILNAIVGGFNGVFNGTLPPGAFVPENTLVDSFALTGNTLRSDFLDAFDGSEPEEGLFLSPPGGSRNLVHDQFSVDVTYNGSAGDGLVDYTLGGFYYSESTGTGPIIDNTASGGDYLFVLGGFAPGLTPQSTTDFLATIGVDPLGPLPASSLALPFLSSLPIPLGQAALVELNLINDINEAFLGAARQSASNTLFIDTEALALYGQATWNISESLRLTGGLRYSNESRDGVGQSVSPFFIDTTDLTGNPILPNIGEYDDDVLDPTVVLEYDYNDDVLLYASYKESFRSGGFNAAAVGLREEGETSGPDFNFGREDITAYEAGIKSTFLDGKLRINAAGYFYDFTNVQTTIALNPIIATSRAIVNTNQEIYGFEVDGQFAFDDNWTARGSYSYIDGETDDVVNPVTGAISERGEIQGAPQNQFLVALNYDGNLGDNDLFGNVSFSHKDDLLRVPETGERLTNQDLLSATVGLGFDWGENRASIRVWGQNLTDNEYTIDILPFDSFSFATQVFGQPRSFGVSFGYDF